MLLPVAYTGRADMASSWQACASSPSPGAAVNYSMVLVYLLHMVGNTPAQHSSSTHTPVVHPVWRRLVDTLCLVVPQVLAFVQDHTEYGQAQLAGNSIHVDRVFLQRYMPELVEHLHYRIVDVSTLKECCRWEGMLSAK